jgi:hypothetical protein
MADRFDLGGFAEASDGKAINRPVLLSDFTRTEQFDAMPKAIQEALRAAASINKDHYKNEQRVVLVDSGRDSPNTRIFVVDFRAGKQGPYTNDSDDKGNAILPSTATTMFSIDTKGAVVNFEGRGPTLTMSRDLGPTKLPTQKEADSFLESVKRVEAEISPKLDNHTENTRLQNQTIPKLLGVGKTPGGMAV